MNRGNRAQCPVCWYSIRLAADGKIVRHEIVRLGDTRPRECAGTGKAST